MLRPLGLVLLTGLSLLAGCGRGNGNGNGDNSNVSPDSGTVGAPGSSHVESAAPDHDVADARNESAQSPEAAASARSPQATPPRSNIGFKTGSGERLYEIKFKDDGAKLVDPQEQELARFNRDGQKLKIKRPDDSVVAYIVAKEGEFQMMDATQKTELFELQRQSDGDWKLKDGSDRLLALIKTRDYGYEIEDGAEHSLFKSKLKDGKHSLRNARDETVLYTKDELPSLSVACFGLEAIDELPVRAGLAVAVLLFAE